ncbi:MAG TPA: ABC transporter substrate-binding protein, partial [Ilumatobacteraceae bacterium]|nr:ABC transporter substrate-binding protein [Ilumatobacteraceae bacterium]
FLPLLVVAGVGVAACSSGESALEVGGDATTPASSTETTPAGGTGADTDTDTTAMPTTTVAPLAELAPCPTEALDSVDGPVDIVFWHAMANDLETPLIALTDAYNASQDKVRVELQNQTGYESLIDKYTNASQSSRPTMVQFPEYMLRSIADSGTTVPSEACLESSGYDTSTFVPRTLTAYQYEGVQRGMPFNVSNPVLYYNRKMFEAAGLDPDDPPVSLDELRAASEQIVSSGAAPVALVLDSGPDSGGGWFLEQWFGRAGEPFADNGNGRIAPATEVLFDNELGVELTTFLQTMINDGLAMTVGDNPGGQDAFFKLADPNAPGAMTMATSAALGSVIAALGGGLVPDLGPTDIGVGPMPGPGETPQVQVGGASLWIVADKSPEETAAAWDFTSFLLQAESQSQWAGATGYVPVRTDALDVEPLATTYATDPRFAVPYEQLLSGVNDDTANAPVLGPQREVRAETSRAMAAIFDGADSQTTLTAAVDASNLLIASYNERN